MTSETFYPDGQLMSRTTVQWNDSMPAIADLKNARVEFNPAQRKQRKQKNRQAKDGRRASRR